MKERKRPEEWQLDLLGKYEEIGLRLTFDKRERAIWLSEDGDKLSDDVRREIAGTEFLERHPKAPRKWRVHFGKGKRKS